MISVIALGSGAVTTVFSAMNALVLRDIPGVMSPEELVSLRPARADGSADDQIGYPLAGWFQFQPLWHEICRTDPDLFD